MGRKSIRISSLAILLLSVLPHIFAHPFQDIQKGEIVDKVICQDKPEQSYALYLPPGYTPEKTWPILYTFDPGAKGRIPLEHFKEAAQKYGFIVVGSNNSRNGPWLPVMEASMAVWTDTNQRFSIDKKRVYATGFSGGSKAAAVFSKFVHHPVEGIIGIGAGLPQQLKSAQVQPSAYFGIVGIGDFNYQPMMRLDNEFDNWNVPHRFLVYDGEHNWPPQEICTRAVEWMEALAMKRKLRPLDTRLIEKIYTKELEKAQRLEEEGQVHRAVSAYEAIVSTFMEWKDSEGISDRISHLKQSKEYRKSMNDEKEIREREDLYRNKFIKTFARTMKYPEMIMNLADIYSELGISHLLNKVKNKKNINEYYLASRLLAELFIHSVDEGWRYYEKGNYKMAIVFHEIAAKASEYKPSRLPYIHYELARFYALNNQKKKALKMLEWAVENGFDNTEAIENQEDLISIRNARKFQKIIKELKDRKNQKRQS
jgi:hypothetical protein